MPRNVSGPLCLMLLLVPSSSMRDLVLDLDKTETETKTEAIPITEFKSGWAEKGYAVTVFDSLAAYQQHFQDQPWKSPSDQKGTKTDVPIDHAVPLPELMESTLLYHGGNIKSSIFGAGVSSIEFDRTMDVITGPCFFVFENAFAAGFYGMTGADHVKAVEEDGSKMSETGYRQVMEFKVSQPDECVGLVPDWGFLEAIAKLDQAEKPAFIESKCGKDCAFIAINWNKEGKANGGALPYELRLLPASIERCKISLNSVLAIKDTGETHAFLEGIRPAFHKARDVFVPLMDLHASNLNRDNMARKYNDNSEE